MAGAQLSEEISRKGRWESLRVVVTGVGGS